MYVSCRRVHQHGQRWRSPEDVDSRVMLNHIHKPIYEVIGQTKFVEYAQHFEVFPLFLRIFILKFLRIQEF